MIETNQTLELRNIICLRGKFSQTQMAPEIKRLESFIAAAGAEKVCPMLTATYAAEQQSDGTALVDIELLFSLDREIPVAEGYMWKPLFFLTNAIKIRHTGSPQDINRTVAEIQNFIAVNHLTPISVAYNQTIYAPTSAEDTNPAIVDIYVGISPNIL